MVEPGGSLSAPARDLLSGIAAGFAVKLFEYPLDTVKVLLQTGGDKYRGPLDCMRQTYAAAGPIAFYRGLPSPLLGSMAECSTLFFAYGYAKGLLGVDEAAATLRDPVPIWKYCLAGCISGFCSPLVLTPVELVKCRLQVQAASAGNARYSGALDCTLQILRQEGPTGLWRGNLSCLAREVPGNMAWFGMYEAAIRGVQLAQGYDRKANVPLAWNALAGASAGVAYWLVPFPADTVKSKLQTDPKSAGKPFLEVLRRTLRTEGLRGLYCGAGITCARAAPAHALLFCVYEVAAGWLRRL